MVAPYNCDNSESSYMSVNRQKTETKHLGAMCHITYDDTVIVRGGSSIVVAETM